MFPRKKPGGRELPRVRVLSDEEIASLWTALETLPYKGTRGQCISPQLALTLQFILCTGQRRGEVATAQWSNIERLPGTAEHPRARRIWRFPGNKNSREHRILLPPPAVRCLARLRRIVGRSQYLLPARGTAAKATDRERSITRATRKLNEELKFREKFTPHDLRRTVRTNFARLGVPQEVAERALNHAQENLMVATYNQHRYTDEIGEAFEKWSALLGSIIGKVTP